MLDDGTVNGTVGAKKLNVQLVDIMAKRKEKEGKKKVHMMGKSSEIHDVFEMLILHVMTELILHQKMRRKKWTLLLIIVIIILLIRN